MKNKEKRNLRLMRIHKAQLSKARMEHQYALGQVNQINRDIADIHAMIEEEGMSITAFPDLTYDHINKLSLKKEQLTKIIHEKMKTVMAQEAQLEKAFKATKSARADISRSLQETEAVENLTHKTSKA